MAQEHATKVHKYFPQALPQSLVVEGAADLLHHRFTKESGDPGDILFASSICPDEINRDIEESTWCHGLGRPFTMGGLAGFPFSGKVGFGAYMAHVPDGGVLLIISASHVGIHSTEDKIGLIRRVGMHKDSHACGSAIAALEYCEKNVADIAEIAAGTKLPLDVSDLLNAQQNYVTQKVAQNYEAITGHGEKMVGLADTLAKVVEKDVNRILPENIPFPLAILSGVQINFEGETFSDDYFNPLSFKIIEKGQTHDLMPELLQYAGEHHGGHHDRKKEHKNKDKEEKQKKDKEKKDKHKKDKEKKEKETKK